MVAQIGGPNARGIERRVRLGCPAFMSGNIPMTPAGLKRLKEEVKHLTAVERPKISKEIEVARAHGDLRENAEYHAAKEKQGHIEGRILDLNDWIARAEV